MAFVNSDRTLIKLNRLFGQEIAFLIVKQLGESRPALIEVLCRLFDSTVKFIQLFQCLLGTVLIVINFGTSQCAFVGTVSRLLGSIITFQSIRILAESKLGFSNVE
jgi:hypothetical protein